MNFLYTLEAETMYHGDEHKDARIRMLNSLAAYNVRLAAKEKDPKKKEKLSQEATDYMNKSQIYVELNFES